MSRNHNDLPYSNCCGCLAHQHVPVVIGTTATGNCVRAVVIGKPDDPLRDLMVLAMIHREEKPGGWGKNSAALEQAS